MEPYHTKVVLKYYIMESGEQFVMTFGTFWTHMLFVGSSDLMEQGNHFSLLRLDKGQG